MVVIPDFANTCTTSTLLEVSYKFLVARGNDFSSRDASLDVS